jgi:HPt (histidine-containing phosphotransfer) domain-containing protein
MPYQPDEILDSSIVSELLEVGDAEFLHDLFDTYIEDAHEKLDGIAKALTEHDAQAMGRLAHTFKGASGNIGASALSQIAEQLQQLGYNDQLEGAEQLVSQLKELYQLVEQAMKVQLQKLE